MFSPVHARVEGISQSKPLRKAEVEGVYEAQGGIIIVACLHGNDV